jgi:kynurenine formamidase
LREREPGFLYELASKDMRTTRSKKGKSSEWGLDDEVGALNRVTQSVLLDSLRIVKKGRVFSLAQVYGLDMPTIPFHGPFFQTTFRTVESVLRENRGYDNKIGSFICRYELSDHTGTHVDSLNHATVGYELYNGIDARDIQTDMGTTRLGIETMPPVVARGVLLDFPSHFRVDMLEGGQEITPSDIEMVALKKGIRFKPGDAVLFYTGYGKLWTKDNAKYLGNAPGLGVRAAAWVVAKGASITGADTSGFDVVGPKTRKLFPCHQVLIKENGIHIVENLKLDELASTGATEFLFVCTPLKLKGGAGSPVAPIALI